MPDQSPWNERRNQSRSPCFQPLLYISRNDMTIPAEEDRISNASRIWKIFLTPDFLPRKIDEPCHSWPAQAYKVPTAAMQAQRNHPWSVLSAVRVSQSVGLVFQRPCPLFVHYVSGRFRCQYREKVQGTSWRLLDSRNMHYACEPLESHKEPTCACHAPNWI